MRIECIQCKAASPEFECKEKITWRCQYCMTKQTWEEIFEDDVIEFEQNFELEDKDDEQSVNKC